jgi:hypothetical protein
MAETGGHTVDVRKTLDLAVKYLRDGVGILSATVRAGAPSVRAVREHARRSGIRLAEPSDFSGDLEGI